MMSEKRFEITEYGSDYYIEIIDNEKELDESIPNPSQKLSLIECVDLLNEQEQIIQNTTRRDTINCLHFKDANKKIRRILKQ